MNRAQRRSVLDLSLGGRALFCAAFLGTQLWLVLTADRRPDRVFGFRMFNESSSLKFDLYRRIRAGGSERLVSVPDGTWQARTRTGALGTFSWTDRVQFGQLMQPGVWKHASYGLDAQLFRLEHALADVAAHISEDTETAALVAIVETRKNGRPAGSRELVAERP